VYITEVNFWYSVVCISDKERQFRTRMREKIKQLVRLCPYDWQLVTFQSNKISYPYIFVFFKPFWFEIMYTHTEAIFWCSVVCISDDRQFRTRMREKIKQLVRSCPYDWQRAWHFNRIRLVVPISLCSLSQSGELWWCFNWSWSIVSIKMWSPRVIGKRKYVNFVPSEKGRIFVWIDLPLVDIWGKGQHLLITLAFSWRSIQ
jgi:hypothetical protein